MSQLAGYSFARELRAFGARHHPASGLRQRHALLPLILPAAILVRRRADLVRLEEQHLRDALVRVDLRGQRRGVRELERHVPFPLRLERRHVDDDPAARVGALAEADDQRRARDAEILHRARERERVRRNDADVRMHVDETLLVERLRVDDRRVDVREDLEFARAAHVVAVARRSVRHDLVTVGGRAHLLGRERLDHLLFLRHATDPVVGLDAHALFHDDLGEQGRTILRAARERGARAARHLEIRFGVR